MRTFIFGMLALLGFSALAKADVVVLSNTNTANGSTNSSATLSIAFTVSSTVTAGNGITSVRLFSNSNVGDSGVQWSISDNITGVLATTSNIAATVTESAPSSGLYYYDYNLSALTTANLSSSATALTLNAIGLDLNLYQLTNTSTMTAVSPYQAGTYSGDVARFELSAVPEPGTLLLGSIAAVTSGGGFWWKRRRKGAVNSAATEPAVN